MLVVLVASVGVAWVLTEDRGAQRNRGEEILRQIRGRNLMKSLWGAKRVDSWYLVTNQANEAVGYQRLTRTFGGGVYRGALDDYRRGRVMAQEEWSLNADATVGQYSAKERRPTGLLVTRIIFREGQVTVISSDQRAPATSRAPLNYIPEGLNRMVFFLAARGEQKAACRMIFNHSAVMGGRVNFETVQLRPAGRDRVRVRSVAGDMIYQFDSRGILERLEDVEGKRVFVRVSAGEVVKHFPEAGRFMLKDRREDKTSTDEDALEIPWGFEAVEL